MGRLGWIDFSRTHRDRVYAVIDFLQEEGTIDELGVGTLRNALADFFFPGFSTIQTRAKYYLIIPRMIWEYKSQYAGKTQRPKLSEYLHTRENRLIRQLAKQYQGTEEKGIIGITLANAPARRELARKPSSIYWNGLRIHDIIRTHLSLGDYLRFHDARHRSIHDLLTGTDELKGDDKDAGYEDQFGIDLPDYNRNWSEELTIDLTRTEAQFLKDKMIHCGPISLKKKENLLGQVLGSDEYIEKFIQAENFNQMYTFFKEENLPPLTQRILHLAYAFDQIIHGAHIRYNVLVQKRCGVKEKEEVFNAAWQNWLEDIFQSQMLDQFEIAFLLNEVAPLAKSKLFVRNWYQQIKEADDSKKWLEQVDKLVCNQEIQKKGKKARLHSGTNDAVNDWVGLERMNYRFQVAKVMVSDIKKGLEN